MLTTTLGRPPRHLVLDMDGTIYLGHTILEGTPALLANVRRHGLGLTFVTNNSSRSKADYLRHLAALGVAIEPGELYTSGDCCLDWLTTHGYAGARIFLLGTDSLAEQFVAAGFRLADDDPQLVIVAFDLQLDYDRLCRAAWWIARGVPFVATHPDAYCPTDAPTLLIDCGAVTAMLERATGRRATVLGKPSPAMLDGALARHNVPHELVDVLGDRLHTDLAMARASGCRGVLVLTGETSWAQAAAADPRPDLVVRDVGHYAELLAAALGD